MSNAYPFPVQDTPITVGVMQCEGLSGELPVFIMEYDQALPSLAPLFERYKELVLDVAQTDTGGFMYRITSRRALAVLTPELLSGFNGTSAEDFRSLLKANAVPEFSAHIEVHSPYHERFMDAKDAWGGTWLLVLLSEVATEVQVGRDGVVRAISTRAREEYEI